MKKVELFEKMDDVDVKIYVGLLKNIEENVKNGGEGVGELRELIEWGYSFGLDNERIVKDLKVEVVKVLLVSILNGYVE